MNLQTEIVSPETPKPSTWRDWLGIVASIGCAIHCAAMPFVIAYLPNLGLSFLADEAFHKWMFVACVGIGLTSFVPGWKLHRRLVPVGIACAGLTLIGFAAFGLAGECCAACEINTAAAAESEHDCPFCEDDCCPDTKTGAETNVLTSLKLTDTELTPTVAQASILSLDFLTPYAPWVTPIGGMLLVCAHLLNRRYGCRCGCCEIPKTSDR